MTLFFLTWTFFPGNFPKTPTFFVPPKQVFFKKVFFKENFQIFCMNFLWQISSKSQTKSIHKNWNVLVRCRAGLKGLVVMPTKYRYTCKNLFTEGSVPDHILQFLERYTGASKKLPLFFDRSGVRMPGVHILPRPSVLVWSSFHF